ncbi:hypothetical protein DFH94DRAFT_50731 [Russula ochroleuca]|jgi:hypothetical protein|uniref:RRM domain-containing protein n=1 Tax=Russula ochroleuca TaxID=152965 RepID=A0A9P5MV41_9AGAM|nr:hypothetical protein DFH94DRAFT_50731 [Russula ochroleuca]
MSAVGAIRGSSLGTAKSLPKGHSPVHVRLTGLPRTSTPADITRLLARNNVHNITNVALDYYRFEPTGRAFLTLTQPSVLPKVLAALKQLRFFGHPLIPRTTKPPPEPRMRSRGLKGREEASERSIISGTGSQGGITDVGRSVMLSGMPGKISTEALRRFLNNYSLMGGQGEVVKIDSNLKVSMTCRVLVRLSSASEAFRLLRNLHMTNYEPDAWQDKYTIRAQLIT